MSVGSMPQHAYSSLSSLRTWFRENKRSRLPSERYLTSGTLHRTRQDKEPHMLPVITVKLSFITQFHPHHLDISRFFPKDPQNRWGPQNNKIGISLVQLKYPLKTREDLDQIFQHTVSSSSVSFTDFSDYHSFIVIFSSPDSGLFYSVGN